MKIQRWTTRPGLTLGRLDIWLNGQKFWFYDQWSTQEGWRMVLGPITIAWARRIV